MAATHLERLAHHWSHQHRWSLRKSPHELVQKLFRRNLQMKWVSTLLDERIEQVKSQHGYVWIPIVDHPHALHRSFTRCIGFLAIDMLCELEVQGRVRCRLMRFTGSFDELLDWRQGHPWCSCGCLCEHRGTLVDGARRDDGVLIEVGVDETTLDVVKMGLVELIE